MEHTVYEAQNPILISLGKLLAAHKVIVFGFGTAFKYLFVARQGGTIIYYYYKFWWMWTSAHG